MAEVLPSVYNNESLKSEAEASRDMPRMKRMDKDRSPNTEDRREHTEKEMNEAIGSSRKKNGKGDEPSRSSSSASSKDGAQCGDADDDSASRQHDDNGADKSERQRSNSASGRQRHRSHHRRSVSSSSSNSSNSSRSSSSRSRSGSVSSSQSDGGIRSGRARSHSPSRSRSRSRSRSYSRSASSASSGQRQASSEMKKIPPKDSVQSAKEMYDNESRSSPSHECAPVKDDVDTVVNMEIGEDAGTSTAVTISSQSDVKGAIISGELKKTRRNDDEKMDQLVKRGVAASSVTTAPPRIMTRKISLQSAKERSIDGSTDVAAEKPQKKRKWGGGGTSSSASVAGKRPSISISTDSLKGLIPDVSLKETWPSPLEAEPEPLVTEEKPIVPEPSRRRSDPEPVVVNNSGSKHEKIVFDSPKETPNEETALDKSVKDEVKGKTILLRTAPVRSAPVVAPNTISSAGQDIGAKTTISVTANPTAGARSPSPARNPPSKIIHIRNLVRPYTLGQLNELLTQTGQLIENGFWIDKIKSKCYVTYASENEAIATRSVLHGIQWPSSNPKRLVADFATQDELDFHRKLADPVIPPKPAPAVVNERNQAKVLATLDETGKPSINKERRHSVKDDRGDDSRGRVRKDRRERDVRSGAEGDSRVPIREWDRDKIGERSPGERARSGRQRGGRADSPPRRSRSPVRRIPLSERDRQSKDDAQLRDRRDRKVERRRDMVEEEAPAKLLDDLFRKTKTAPCIYWLPLTSEQIVARENQRKQRQVEREKIRQGLGSDAPGTSAVDLNTDSRRNNRENRDISRNRRPADNSGRSRFRRR